MPPPSAGYPAPRTPRGAGTPSDEQLASAQLYEGTAGTVTLGAADAEIIVFSGVPDRLVLTTFVQDALVTLTDELGRDGYTMRLAAGVPTEAPVQRRRVVARQVAAGALLQVVAYWSRRAAYLGPAARVPEPAQA